MLFESILLVTGHQILSSTSSGSSEAGCGRWTLGSKNSVRYQNLYKTHGYNNKILIFSFYFQVVFHDINIATLVGADLEKVCKIHKK